MKSVASKTSKASKIILAILSVGLFGSFASKAQTLDCNPYKSSNKDLESTILWEVEWASKQIMLSEQGSMESRPQIDMFEQIGMFFWPQDEETTMRRIDYHVSRLLGNVAHRAGEALFVIHETKILLRPENFDTADARRTEDRYLADDLPKNTKKFLHLMQPFFKDLVIGEPVFKQFLEDFQEWARQGRMMVESTSLMHSFLEAHLVSDEYSRLYLNSAINKIQDLILVRHIKHLNEYKVYCEKKLALTKVRASPPLDAR